MNDNRYEPEYEREYYASSPLQRWQYFLYLWGRTREPEGRQEIEVKQTRARKPVQQKEEVLWFHKDGYHFTCATKPIPKRVLRATGTKASDWMQGYGPGPRIKKDEGTSKGPRQMAVQRLRKGMQGESYEGLRDYRDHKDY